MTFAHLTNPIAVIGPCPPRCTRKASGHLPHSRDPRPVAVCRTRTGAKVYLCAGCLSALRTERYAVARGHCQAGEGQLAALRDVLEAPAGYEAPSVATQKVHGRWHSLITWEQRGLIRRLRRELAAGTGTRLAVLFAGADSCLDCLYRVGHAADCGAKMGPEFAVRRVVAA